MTDILLFLPGHPVPVPSSSLPASYYQKRMNEIGATSENMTLRLLSPETFEDRPEGIWRDEQIFTEDKNGNILILMYYLNRHKNMWWQKKSAKAKLGQHKLSTYQLTRLVNPKLNQGKYLMPSGMGTMCFYPPQLLKAYEERSKIRTLVMTEGAFKAFRCAVAGAAVVGLSSITHYRDKSTKKLFQGIVDIIVHCEVENVVICWDGDCLELSLSDLEFRNEASKRPRGFYSAVKNIRNEIVQIELDRPPPKIYFAHVRSADIDNHPKGLDDLFNEVKKDKEIVMAMNSCEKSPWLYFLDITSGTFALNEYFLLGNVDSFYVYHQKKIQGQEFVFNSDVYVYNERREQVILVSPEWAKRIKWVGDHFYIVANVPGAKIKRRALLERKKTTLSTLHGKNFIKFLTHHEGFCNVPNHFEYQQVVENYYNRYFPFRHRLEQGPSDSIQEFIKHIFGEEKLERAGQTIFSYELAFDYLQIMLTDPTQHLPVICLYSPENSTGKSTFGKLCAYIFGDNCIQIGNSDLKSDFNETFSDKLLVFCEETLLERKADIEKIKALSTSDQITVNAKGLRQFTLDFFCKFMFFSNRIRMLYLTKHDDRFWVRRVFKPKKDIPNLLEKMKAEVPAFLFFLANRELVTKKEGRMWFHPSLYLTKTFNKMVEINENQDVANLREKIRTMFFDFEIPESFMMPMYWIKKKFFASRTSERWIKEILEENLGVEKLREKDGKIKQVRGSFPYWGEDTSQNPVKYTQAFNGRPYVFMRKNFISDEE